MAEPGGGGLDLRGLHVPDGVSPWPPGPGWWLVAGAALIGALLTVWRLRRGGPLRRAARRELARVAAAYGRDGDHRALAARVSRLLRRTARERWGWRRVAALTGEAWLAFLDEGVSGSPFREGPGRALARAPYRPGETVDGPGLLRAAREWIEAQA